jgi:hypothetical protein
MTHKDNLEPDHIDMDHDPRCNEDTLQVWALKIYYSTFFHRFSVKKWPFSDLKTYF